VFPLGGYVKMLGQEDNPARLKAEIERAKDQQEANIDVAEDDSRGQQPAESEERGGATGSSSGAGPHPSPLPEGEGTKVDIAAAERALYDPRSYLSKSVPQRMAIISAGVIMNLIFAFLCAVWAYGIGLPQIECGVGSLLPGAPAWAAGFEVGDRITAIGGEPVKSFKELTERVVLGETNEPTAFTVERPGVEEPIEIVVTPDLSQGRPTIGVTNPYLPELATADRAARSGLEAPSRPGTPARAASAAFEFGDRIVAINGQPIDNFAQVHRHLATEPDQTLTFTIERAKGETGDAAGEPAKSRRQSEERGARGEGREGATADSSSSAGPHPNPLPEGEGTEGGSLPEGEGTREITVAPRRMKHLGLIMQMGPITAIERGSPAERAGIEPNDTIVAIDGRSVGNPLSLPDRLRNSAGEEATLTLLRDDKTRDVTVTLRPTTTFALPRMPKDPVTVPALGVAYWVESEITAITPGSPADEPAMRNVLKPGMTVTGIRLLPPEDLTEEQQTLGYGEESSADFSQGRDGWAGAFYGLQETLPGTRVEVTVADGEKVTLEPAEADGWFHPERGLMYQPPYFIRSADGFGDALALGWDETVGSVMQVYVFIQKLFSQDISARMLGGPITIAQAAGRFASEGFAPLLVFLTLLSANLAVLNFLPIPLLDGGHFVFLAYEGITGKPADERLQIILTYIGLALLLTLMLWVTALDVGLISRQ